MASEEVNKRARPANWAPPKGGARYPQYGLREALAWAQKLVSKTHLGPQPSEIVFASVVSSKGPTGQIKVSALKQFDLLEGSSKAYGATALAKAISAAPDDEKTQLYAKAALAPAVFKALFDTYHGDEVTLAKLKQRAADLNIHPDKADHCISVYVDTIVIAGLAVVEGDRVTHKAAAALSEVDEPQQISSDDDQGSAGSTEVEGQSEERGDSGGAENQLKGAAPRAIFHVNVNLDASLDTEKLEKHLALLKRYGAI